MYAVFSTGGKQYRAATGDIIKVEKLEADQGATVELDQVLMVGEGADVEVGSPLVKGGKVTAKVVEHGRGDKVKVIKFKRRKNYMKQMGHRQYYTMLEITGIEGAGPAKPKKAGKAAAKAEDQAKAGDEAKAGKKAESKPAPKAKAKTTQKTAAKAKPKAAAKSADKTAAKTEAAAEAKADKAGKDKQED